ncbi:ribonuclease T2-like protein [Phascolomyces articulosus]|uniref:ribonuclease T2 n=1 Tax=Phascolomyces articulosus TaxID=60185 RepID=A0AAD5K0M5_9FUNG|nr:ribonuclease T2-like protein [Phascolomyces articulosus]
MSTQFPLLLDEGVKEKRLQSTSFIDTHDMTDIHARMIEKVLAPVTIMDDGPTCNRSVLSCHWGGQVVDTCCSPKYGLVVLALQWVPGYGPDDEFTIHGLWPDTCSGGRAPSRGCDRSRSSGQVGNILKRINPDLHQQMKTFWPSYKGDDNWFWSHEWTKHGTCVSTLRPVCYGDSYRKFEDLEEYFKQVLYLREDYDIYGALNLAGIFPGNWYNSESMRDALQQFFGSKIMLNCNRDGQLSEVMLYFYVSGRDRYQITNALGKGSCRGAVWYPKKS